MPRSILRIVPPVVLLAFARPVVADDACTLGALANRAGVAIGAAFVEGSGQPEFRALLGPEFNSTTAGVYWSTTEPQPGVFEFSASDAAVAEAQARGLRVRGHPLVWGRLALPAWVGAITDPSELRSRTFAHIDTIVRRYAGTVAQWDVVNEPLTAFGDPGTTDGLEPYIFHRLLGPDYIAEALAVAHAADPTAKLFVNDFFVLAPGAKQDRFFRLARELLAAGAPLHGVGFQGHIMPPFGPRFRPTATEMQATFERFAALGLEIEVTEVDVTVPAATPCEFARQGDVYCDIMAACLAVPACRGVTVWGMGDGFTWIKNFFGVDGRPLIYDLTWQPKPAYRALQDALLAAVCPDGACTGVCKPALPRDDLAACACDRVGACGDVPFPTTVSRWQARACNQVDRAAGVTDGLAHRHLGRAATGFRRAARAARRLVRRGALAAACDDAFEATFAAGRVRLLGARSRH
jgi:endo-1,4-beta-xylanase